MKAHILRIAVGLAALIVGALLLLDTLNIADTSDVIADWWPLLIISGGILMLLNNVRDYLWALLVIVFGVAAQLRELDYIDVNPWQALWPLVLIAVGVSIIFKRPASPKLKSGGDADDIVAILGGSDQKSTSDSFVSSNVTAVMGGAKLDLRKAVIKKEATIEIFALMGGVELVVPRNVTVKNKVNVILGGVENKTDQDLVKNAPVLTIIGDVVLGGVEIKN